MTLHHHLKWKWFYFKKFTEFSLAKTRRCFQDLPAPFDEFHFRWLKIKQYRNRHDSSDFFPDSVILEKPRKNIFEMV